MPRKRIECRGNSKQSIAGALAECVLPEDMMLCILTRLPVKSVHRFKSVCKPWRKALSSPEFRKMHRSQFSQNPENHSIVIHGFTDSFCGHTMSLLKIGSDERKKPTKLDIPSPPISFSSEFIGCCNGLFCAALTEGGRQILLWNPALNSMSKLLPLPDPGVVSIGFGYNEESDDFMVVRIDAMWVENKNTTVGVEVYSANWDSWTKMEPGFEFRVFQTKNDVIVNGSPYWHAVVDGKEVLVCFDVREMMLKIVPLPDIIYEEMYDFVLVDLKGKLGALVCDEDNEERVDVWVFDDAGKTGWTKNRSFGTIEFKMKSFLECLKNGKIPVGVCLGEEGKLFEFDTENGGVKEIVIDEALFQIYGYTESLAYIKGMVKHK